MSRTLKIFLLILGLSIFILPKQVVFAQNTEQCCDKKSEAENCCTKKKDLCHSENSPTKSEKHNCDDGCTSCQSCSVHFVLTFITTENIRTSAQVAFDVKRESIYEVPSTSSILQNIWQPPKIS